MSESWRTIGEKLDQIRDEQPHALRDRQALVQHQKGTPPVEAVGPLANLSDADLQLLHLLLTDYYAFATFGLGNWAEDYAGFADPGVINYVDRYGHTLMDWLANRTKQTTYRRTAIIVPRECTKSTLITQAGPVFLSLHDPNIAMFISSATMDSKPSAAEFAAGVARHWEGRSSKSIIAQFYGSLVGPVWRKNKYVIATRTNTTRRDPTLGVFSVQTGGTSGHFNAGWLDDPVTYEQVERFGDGWHESCWAHYLSLGYVIQQHGLLSVVMTRYGASDLMGQIIDVEIAPAVRRRTFPGKPEGQLPGDFQTCWHKYAHLGGWEAINMAAEFDEDGNPALSFPVVWPQERVDNERVKSPAVVSAQLNNRPGLTPEHPIRPRHIERAWFDSLDDVPEPAFGYLTLQCDLAIKKPSLNKERTGDFTVLELWAHHEGHVYLIWSWRGRPTQEEFDDRLLEVHRFAQGPRVASRIRLMTYDKPIGLGAGADYTKSHFEMVLHEAGMRVPRILEIARQGKNKIEDRILQTAPFWVSGMVHLLKDSPCSSEIAAQVLNPYGCTHDDDADAFADVFHEDVYLKRVPKRPGGPSSHGRDNVHSTAAVPGRYDPKTGLFRPTVRYGGSRLRFGGL